MNTATCQRRFSLGCVSHRCLCSRPFLEWGALALLMLAKVTGNASYAAEAQQPLAYTLTTIATYQASHGYREAVPTFMQISALRGGNSAVSKPRTRGRQSN